MTITVNKQEWAALSADQQAQISSIISNNFDGQTIVPGDGVSASADTGGICQTGCDLAQAAAIQLSGKLPFWKGICISAAKMAGDYCREQC